MPKWLQWSALLVIALVSAGCGSTQSRVTIEDRNVSMPTFKADWQVREWFAVEADITAMSGEDDDVLGSDEKLVLGDTVVREGPADLHHDVRLSMVSLLARFDFIRRPYFDFDFMVGAVDVQTDLEISDGVSRWHEAEHEQLSLAGVAIASAFSDKLFLRGKLMRDPLGDIESGGGKFHDAELIVIYQLFEHVDVFAGWREIDYIDRIGRRKILMEGQSERYNDNFRTYADLNFSGPTFGLWVNF